MEENKKSPIKKNEFLMEIPLKNGMAAMNKSTDETMNMTDETMTDEPETQKLSLMVPDGGCGGDDPIDGFLMKGLGTPIGGPIAPVFMPAPIGEQVFPSKVTVDKLRATGWQMFTTDEIDCDCYLVQEDEEGHMWWKPEPL